MVKVNPSLPPWGGNARLLLGKPTLGGFINSEQQGSRYRSAESHLLRAKHSRSAERSVPSLSWRRFPPDLLYGADMATNRLQHIVQDLIYCCRHETKRRSKSLRYHGLCHAGSRHPCRVNSDGWGSRAGPCGCFAVRALRSPDPTPSARAHSRFTAPRFSTTVK